MDACSTAVVGYWHEVTDEAGHQKDADDEKEKNTAAEEKPRAGKQDTPGSASTDPPKDADMGEEGKASQKVWEIKTWNLRIKMAPGITQFERRLGAPLHGLMNAYQRLRPLREGVLGTQVEDPHP